MLQAVHPETWMADTDLGKMFLNFVLHESLRELAGVDVTHYRDDQKNQEGLCWER
jgi:predicted AAA+ superfamily ATPase